MDQTQPIVAGNGSKHFEQPQIGPKAAHSRRFQPKSENWRAIQNPSKRPLLRRVILPPANPILPVRGKNCNSKPPKIQRCLFFNLWCMREEGFWCKLGWKNPSKLLAVDHSRRCITLFPHFFCFSPKLTTCIIRSRLGGVPPLRPLVYLLDGT